MLGQVSALFSCLRLVVDASPLMYTVRETEKAFALIIVLHKC